MRFTQLKKLACIPLFIIGFLLIGLATYIFISVNDFVDNSVQVTAVIADISIYSDVNGENSHNVYIDYEYAGRKYEHKDINAYNSNMFVGKSIKVYVNVNHPSDARYISYMPIFILAGIAVVLFVAGIWGALSNRKLSKSPKGKGRHFSSVETKDSRVKWKKADPLMVDKLKAAIKSVHIHKLKTSRSLGVSAIFLFFPVMLFLLYFVAIRESQPLFADIIVYASTSLFFIAYLIRYIKHPPRPRYNLEKYNDIWIVRAKCTDAFMSGILPNEQYYAAFSMGRVDVCLELIRMQYKANPVGKEYVFFKFNDRSGNVWEAIAADDLDAF